MANELFGTPTQQPSTLKRIGAALGGFGAGVQGRGPEYLAGLREQRAEEEKKRLAAMIKDAKTTYDLLNTGNLVDAQALILDRIQMINKLGGDPSDTARIGSMLEAGRIGEAMNELRGFLRPFMPTEAIPTSEVTSEGQRFIRDPLTGEVTAEDVAGFRAKPEEVDVFKQESDFRKEFNALPQVKDFALRRTGLNTVLASAEDPSAAGDVSLIFAYMKMLDPTSVVREGEFETVQKTASIPDYVWAKWLQAQEGTRLVDTVRDDFVDRARRLYNRAAKDFGEVYSRYESIARRNNLDPSRALIDYRYDTAAQQIPLKAINMNVTPEIWAEMTEEERAAFN